MTLPAHLMVSECDGHMYDTRREQWSRHPIRPNYAYVQTDVKRNSIALRAAIRQAYAWPGGYEIVGITRDGGVLCSKCMRKHYRSLAWSMRQQCDDGWLVDWIANSSEYDELTCDHCDRVIVGDEE